MSGKGRRDNKPKTCPDCRHPGHAKSCRFVVKGGKPCGCTAGAVR